MGKVLVVGGGIAGMQSSLDLANMGHIVCLVEKEKELGGNLRNIYKVFPANDKAEELLSNYVQKTKKHNNISVLTNSTLEKFKSKSHTFAATIKTEGEHATINVDAVVLATGFVSYDPTEKKEYGYNKYSDVITSMDFERMMKEGNLAKPSNFHKPQSVTFVQCVGFRDAKAYRYCSYFCCTLAMKNALLIKKENPDIEVTVMYMDIRTPYDYENLFFDARKTGVKFVRARPAEIFQKNNNRLTINFENTLTSEIRSVESDLVVLSVGGTPPSETEKLSQMMNVSLDDAGFFKVHKRPAGTDANRIFVAGAACGPKDIDYSLSQAGAAASQINKLLGETHVAGE